MWSIVVAAGSGSRLGGQTPKQYITLGTRRVLDWALDSVRSVGPVVLVVGPERLDDPEPSVERIAAGGATRSDSVRAGLREIPGGTEVVLIHDAARPFASQDLVARVLAAIGDGADAAIPGVPVIDTIKEVEGPLVVGTLDRSRLIAVQTPQAFRADALRAAHAGGTDATDDAALVEALGGTVVWVEGEAANRKLTTIDDLSWFEAEATRRSTR